MPSANRSRQFIGTYNNPDVTMCESYLEHWSKLPWVAYVTGQLEKGQSGTLHIQYLVHCTTAWPISKLKTVCQKSHFETVKVDNGVAAYCQKLETRIEGPWEFGKLPHKANTLKPHDKDEAIVEMGVLAAYDAGLVTLNNFVKTQKNVNALKIARQTKFEHPTTRGIWLHGPSGCGKSKAARHIYAKDQPYYMKNSLNKWFDGYEGEKVIIIDDLDETFLGHYLKIWLDHYACTGEIKGGQVALQHTTLIITSNFTPAELFADKPHNIIPIARRCTIINMGLENSV